MKTRKMNGGSFAAIVLQILRQNRRLMGLILLAFCLMVPISIIFIPSSAEFYSYGDGNLQTILTMYRMTLIFLYFFGAILPFILYSWLFRRSALDVYYSFPVSREKLYASHLTASFLIVYLPFFISLTLGSVLTILMKDFPREILLLAGELLLKGIIILPVVALPSVLMIIFSTGLFDAVMYTIIFYLTPYALGVVLTRLQDLYFFVGERFTDTPFFHFLQLPTLVFTFFYGRGNTENYVSIGIWLILSLLVLVLCSRLFRKKKAESAGNPEHVPVIVPIFTNFFAYLCLIGLVTMGRTGTIRDELRYLFFIFALGLALYFAFDMVRKRGKTRFVRMAISYVGIFILSLTTIFLFKGPISEYYADKEMHALAMASDKNPYYFIVDPSVFEAKASLLVDKDPKKDEIMSALKLFLRRRYLQGHLMKAEDPEIRSLLLDIVETKFRESRNGFFRRGIFTPSDGKYRNYNSYELPVDDTAQKVLKAAYGGMKDIDEYLINGGIYLTILKMEKGRMREVFEIRISPKAAIPLLQSIVSPDRLR